MFRHDTRNEYLAWFCEDFRNTASKIASMEYPEEAPRAFCDHHELDKAYEESIRRRWLVPMCACAAVQKLAAATRTAALFRELLDSMTPV